VARCHHDPRGEVRPLPTGAAAPDGHRRWIAARPSVAASFQGRTTLTLSGVDRTFREITIGIGVRTATERPCAPICDTALPAAPLSTHLAPGCTSTSASARCTRISAPGAMVAVSFTSRARTFNGAGARTVSDDLIRPQKTAKQRSLRLQTSRLL
jgi:hypothetical protein